MPTVVPFRKGGHPSGSAERAGGQRPRRAPAWPAVVAVLLHVVLRQVFDSWLNSQNDWKFGLAAVVVAAPMVFAAFAVARAFRLIPPRRRSEPQYPHPDSQPEEPPSWH